MLTYLVTELAGSYGHNLKIRQEKFEQCYWENDILFNMKKMP